MKNTFLFLISKQARDTYLQLVLIVGLYLVGWALLNQTGIITLKAITGLLMLAVLPGYWLVEIVNPQREKWGSWGKFGLIVLTSFAIITSAQLITRASVPFTLNSQSMLLVLINLFLAAIGLLSGKNLPTFDQYRSLFLNTKKNFQLKSFLIALTPVLFFIATYLINPTIDDSDSYLNILLAGIRDQMVPLLSRTLFLPYLGIYHLATGISLALIYKLSLSLLFYGAFFIVYDYCRRNIKDTTLQTIAYLSLLAPPVILTEVNIIRPQVVLLALVMPFFLLLFEGLRRQEWKFILLANWLTVITLGYHELGLISVIFACLVDIYFLWDQIFRKKTIKITLPGLALLAVAIYPYLILYPPQTIIEPALSRVSGIFNLVHGLSWRWWFINSYRTVDNYEVGWPGIQAAYYYLYNGLLFIIVFAIIALFTIKKQRTDQLKSNYWVLPLLYAGIFFFFAEIMPRLGIFFLPNRAWPYLMLGLLMTFILFIEQHQERLKNFKKWMVFFAGGAIVVGGLATLYLSYNRVGTVFVKEFPAARYIRKEIDPRALIVSTQPNNDLITYYTERDYGDLKLNDPHFTNEDEFYRAINQEVDTIIEKSNIPTIIPPRKTVTYFYSADVLTAVEETVIDKGRTIAARPIDPSKGAYFVYSFVKLQGINGQRPYNQARLNKSNENYFETIHKSNIVYRDKNVIVIKIR